MDNSIGQIWEVAPCHNSGGRIFLYAIFNCWCGPDKKMGPPKMTIQSHFAMTKMETARKPDIGKFAEAHKTNPFLSQGGGHPGEA
jgi:hypothetical protein